MNDTDFARILDAVDGYWPHSGLKANAKKAWRHMLGRFPVDSALDAICDYAAEGHPFPPVAGQLAARISPPRTNSTETEIERVRRQKKYATELVSSGRMAKADFDFYDETYWQPVEQTHAQAA